LEFKFFIQTKLSFDLRIERIFNNKNFFHCQFGSLFIRLGDDDMFSSDLTDEELNSRLSHVQIPCLIAFSCKDEYLPPNVDALKLCSRIQAAIPNSSLLTLPDANHGITAPADIETFVRAVIEFIVKLSM
jgi:pimeloyl-ACP methyl ester carboxylesterase